MLVAGGQVPMNQMRRLANSATTLDAAGLCALTLQLTAHAIAYSVTHSRARPHTSSTTTRSWTLWGINLTIYNSVGVTSLVVVSYLVSGRDIVVF